MMTVAELISALQKLPGDAVVVTPWDDEPFASPVISVSWSEDPQDGRTLDIGEDDRVSFVSLDIERMEPLTIFDKDDE